MCSCSNAWPSSPAAKALGLVPARCDGRASALKNMTRGRIAPPSRFAFLEQAAGELVVDLRQHLVVGDVERRVLLRRAGAWRHKPEGRGPVVRVPVFGANA